LKNVIDISVPLQKDMPIWPGSAGFQLIKTARMELGHEENVSRLDCDVHAGTHVDAPRHFFHDGITVEQLPLETLMGPAFVAYLPDVNSVTARDLSRLDLPPGVKRLLLRTSNSNLWARRSREFCSDYVALTPEASQWVVDQSIRLVGIDYLSIQRFGDSPLTHRILLKAGVIILEGVNLANVRPGIYELICLPLKLVDSEGAPARAVLRCHAKAD
jgi:arylformamidase